MSRILGLDVGSVRIGVALSDPLGFTAQPLEVIHRRQTDPFQHILHLVEAHEVRTVVVGYPLRLAGDTGPAVEAVERFIVSLTGQEGWPHEVTLEKWDERLTTAAAERALIAADMRREKRRNTVDKVAAALILQSYLDARSGPCGGSSVPD